MTIALTGCSGWGTEITGELVSKEYEPRNCERWKGTTCKSWDPSEFEFTIKEDGTGNEVELVVHKSVYGKAIVGSHGTWKGRLD